MDNEQTTRTTRFVERGLFGGAIKVKLPESFFDTSKIREIPDHQEVYLDRDGFSSITIDILERVTETATDEAALIYHLFDIKDDRDRLCITSSASIDLARHLVPAYSITACTKPVLNDAGGKDFTVIMLLLLRLEMQETDISIAVNVPYRGMQFTGDVFDLSQKLSAGLADDNFELGLDIMQAIQQSFEIQDWGLFGD